MTKLGLQRVLSEVSSVSMDDMPCTASSYIHPVQVFTPGDVSFSFMDQVIEVSYYGDFKAEDIMGVSHQFNIDMSEISDLVEPDIDN